MALNGIIVAIMMGESYFFDIKPCHSHRKDALPPAIVKNAFQQHTEGENSNMSRLSTFTTRALSAPFLKPTLALLAACFVGGVWGDQHNWLGVGGAQLYWEDSSSWSTPEATSVTEWIINVQGAKVGFKTDYTQNYVSGDTAPLVILSGNTTPIEFTADGDNPAYGLTKNGPLDVSAWWAGYGTGKLKVNSGTYSFTDINIGRWANLGGYLDIEGGTVIAENVYIGMNENGNTANGTLVISSAGELKMGGLWGPSTGTVTVNGGKITATKDNQWFINGEITFTVGENGATLDTNGKSLTVIPVISGQGTLQVIGGGTVNFSGTPTCTVVADADTTVTGAGNVASTEAVTIIAPSDDWASKTLPTSAGVKTVASGNWATYADGGEAYKQTLGSDTAYVSLVNVGDGNNGATIAGVSDMGSATAKEDYSNVSMDVYTVLKSGSLADVVGGYSIVGPYYCIVKGNLLTSIQGGAPGNVSGAGAIASHQTSYVVSRVDGNTGVVVEGNAKVQGSIAGGFYLYAKDGYGQTSSGARLNKVNGAGANTSVLVKNVQDENSATALTGEGYVISGACIDDTRNMYALVSGNSSVVVDIADGNSGAFAKTIVGGPVRPFNNGNGAAPRVNGNSSVEISAPEGVTFTKPIIGGAYAYRAYAQVDGNSSVTINGGTYTSTICAGANYHGLSGTQYSGAVDSCSVGGDATLTINGGIFSSAYLSGGAASGVKTLAFTADADISSCTIDTGTGAFGKITIAKNVTVTIASSQQKLFTDQGLSVEENAGVYTAKYIEQYYWSPAGVDNNWSNLSNWKVGVNKDAAESLPTSSNPVVFSTASEVNVDVGTAAAWQLIVNANVTLTGNLISVAGVSGSGTITLGDHSGFSISANMTLANALNVTASSSAPASIVATSGFGCTYTGTLTGTGHVKFSGSGAKHVFNGKNSFNGIFEVDEGATTGNFLSAASMGSAAVKWIVNYTGGNSSGKYSNFIHQNSTGSEVACAFGTLSGTLGDQSPSSHGPVIFTVGALCAAKDTMSLTYTGTSNTGRDSVFKMVGAGTLAITATNVRRYECDSGTIELMTAASLPRTTVNFNGGTLKLNSAITTATDPSAKFVFKNDTTAILDDGGVSREFATAIGNDANGNATSANFTKKGTGTLTLSQPPTYTGTTTVEAGTLVINGEFNTSSTVIAPGATLKVSIPVKGAPANIVVDVKDFESVGITAGMPATEKSAKLEATLDNGNGLPVWQNYVMNIEGNATQKFAAVVTPTTGETMTVATSFGSTAGRTGAGVRVTYKLMKKSGNGWVQVGDPSTQPSFSVDPSTLEPNARLKIQAVFQ